MQCGPVRAVWIIRLKIKERRAVTWRNDNDVKRDVQLFDLALRLFERERRANGEWEMVGGSSGMVQRDVDDDWVVDEHGGSPRPRITVYLLAGDDDGGEELLTGCCWDGGSWPAEAAVAVGSDESESDDRGCCCWSVINWVFLGAMRLLAALFRRPLAAMRLAGNMPTNGLTNAPADGFWLCLSSSR